MASRAYPADTPDRSEATIQALLSGPTAPPDDPALRAAWESGRLAGMELARLTMVGVRMGIGRPVHHVATRHCWRDHPWCALTVAELNLQRETVAAQRTMQGRQEVAAPTRPKGRSRGKHSGDPDGGDEG